MYDNQSLMKSANYQNLRKSRDGSNLLIRNSLVVKGQNKLIDKLVPKGILL